MRDQLKRLQGIIILAIAGLCAAATASVIDSNQVPLGMAKLPDGVFRPLFAPNAAAREQQVKSFYLDVLPVTTADYLDFVTENPVWRRSNVRALYADNSYLKTWESDLVPGPSCPAQSPVTHVSWFAANAYAKAKGKRLPTVAEWEYAAAAGKNSANGTNETDHLRRILAWYNSPSSKIGNVGKGEKNFWGVQDLHGLVWEWVADFNSSLVSGDARNDGGPDSGLFCGAGAQGAKDIGNFPAFMRYGFRSSLKADYCIHNLGFRCARDLDAPEPIHLHACCRKALAPAPCSAKSLFNLNAPWERENGESVRLSDLAGKPQVLVMFFAQCQSACPILVNDAMRIESALPADLKGKVNFTLISFDSANDTPEALQKYKESRQLGSNWALLHGDPDAVRELAALLGVRYQKAATGGFNHSNLITVLNANGEITYQLSGLNQDIAGVVTALKGSATQVHVAAN